MSANRTRSWAVPFILVFVVVFGTLSPRTALAQDSGPYLYLPLISLQSKTATSVSGFFVSIDGRPGGDGSRSRPWDLQTALNHPSAVKPGDTIWVRGGTYGSGGDFSFDSRLEGAPDRWITVRAFPGERVKIDGGIEVKYPWSTFWGLEVMNSNPDRVSSQTGSHPDDIHRGDGFIVSAPHTRLINNIIHDTRQGVGFWSQAPDSEMYGNIIYNNGWFAPDRGHGHGVYIQNEDGAKLLEGNMIFSNFSGYSIHAFSTEGYLNQISIQGNVLINGDLLVGSVTQPARQIQVVGNQIFNGQATMGYKAQGNLDLVFKENLIYYNEGQSLEIKWWHDVQISGNRVLNLQAGTVSFLYPNSWGAYQLNYNTYSAPSNSAFWVNSDKKTWEQWRSATGFDRNSSFTTQPPAGVEVSVQRNRYEPKRGTITVYNWDRQDRVIVDISDIGLKPGDTYTLHNVQNFYKDPLSGVYTGDPIQIPMKGWSAALPTGYGELLGDLTFPEFGVFVLRGN